MGLLEPLISALSAAGTRYVVFDAVTADAPIPVIEKGIARFEKEGCDAIVAFGGGSPMDAAKTIALAVANRKHPAAAGRLLQGAARADADLRGADDRGHRLRGDGGGGRSPIRRPTASW